MKKTVLMLCLILSIMSCSSVVKNSYRSLIVASEAYDFSMKSVAEAQRSGKITAEQRQEINEVASVYYTAYQKAVDALESYVISESSEDKEKAIEALRDATAAITDLIKIVADYTREEKGNG